MSQSQQITRQLRITNNFTNWELLVTKVIVSNKINVTIRNNIYYTSVECAITIRKQSLVTTATPKGQKTIFRVKYCTKFYSKSKNNRNHKVSIDNVIQITLFKHSYLLM